MKSIFHPPTILLVAAAGVVLSGSGCTSPASSTPAAPKPPAPAQAEAAKPPPPPEGVPLVVGMPTTQVEELLGRPAEVRPMEVNGVKADVWVYVREGTPKRREITTGMREIQWIDPVSGRELTRQEPILGWVTETPQLELRLLIFKGSLVNWTQIVLGADSQFS